MTMAPPIRLSLPEQVLAAEVGYYQQCEAIRPTQADANTWKRKYAVLVAWSPLTGMVPPPFCSPEFKRYLLERHGYSLHEHMAAHLKPAAWHCWCLAGGLVHPPRK